jgi:hypothetical protein
MGDVPAVLVSFTLTVLESTPARVEAHHDWVQGEDEFHIWADLGAYNVRVQITDCVFA